MKDDRKIIASQYVNVMADYMSSGIWHLDGQMMDFDELPVSDRTKKKLSLMISEYDACVKVDPDEALFSEKSYLIAREIKLQLPDWTVHFYNYKDQMPLMPAGNHRSEVDVSKIESIIYQVTMTIKVP